MTGEKKKKRGGIKIINEDILKFDLSELKKEFHGEPYKIVANLPYNITSRFLRIFLEADYRPMEMILMVQNEVAKRICALPGEMSVLSVSVQIFCEPEILFRVSPGSFFPAPKVDSAVIKLANIRGDKFKIDQKKLFEIVKAGFSARRKQLRNNLKQIFGNDTEQILRSAGIKPEQRPQELTVEDWVKLIASFQL
jgi:16S rRNA (adenine1518-N6/adenine1519-N6)-dimethyltransferase